MLFFNLALRFGVLCLLVLLAGRVVKGVLRRRSVSRAAAARGCQPPPTVPSKGLWGLRTLLESIRATKEERGVQWIANEMDKVGKNRHTCRAQILDYELLLTRDTENIKAMMATQSSDFDIGPHRAKMFYDLLGLGVMTARGDAWKHSRALVRPQFAREQLKNVDLFEPHVQALMRRLPVDSESWTSKLDLSPLFFNLTLDVSTEFLFGQSVHSQSPELQARLAASAGSKAPSLASFGTDLDMAKAILDRRGAFAKYGWLINDNRFPHARDTVEKFVDYWVNRELSHSSDTEKQIQGSMSDKFVLLHELAQETRDPITLRNELRNVLHAARDTTACLLGWTFYFLARHPDILRTLRYEILTTFPFSKSNPYQYQNITFEKIWNCRYMVNVVNETLRHASVVPMNERTAYADTTLPVGGGPDGKSPIFVPKGTQILIPLWAMQHREDIWGSDVMEFKPERFENRKFSWDFVPFAGGARQCIGQQFARTEAMYAIVRILQRFDAIENLEPPGTPTKYHHTIENRSGTGVQVRLHAAA